jgi:hypothetical protein
MRQLTTTLAFVVLSVSAALAGCMASAGDADTQSADEALGCHPQPAPPTCTPVPGGTVDCTAPGYNAPDYSKNPLDAQGPTSNGPDFPAPTYKGPTIQGPTYKQPTYQQPGDVPNIAAPTYPAPTYPAPTFEGPVYQAPTYEGPTYLAPVYLAPTYIPGALSLAPNCSPCNQIAAGQGMYPVPQPAPIQNDPH